MSNFSNNNNNGFKQPVFITSINNKSKPANIKRYECNQCSKYFARPSALQTHIYTHTGEKPHQCDIPGCGRRFAVISNLRRHLRVHKPNYVRRRLTSQERREFVERLMQKSDGTINHYYTTTITNSSCCLSSNYEASFRLLKPKETRPLCLTVKHLLN